MAGNHNEHRHLSSRSFMTEEAASVLFGIGLVLVVALIIGAIALNPFTESGQRALKSLRSDWGGGIERTVTVYDEHGDVLREWHGTFDIDENDQEVRFDIDGRRVIIHGGVVIVQEETEEEWQARVAERNG